MKNENRNETDNTFNMEDERVMMVTNDERISGIMEDAEKFSTLLYKNKYGKYYTLVNTYRVDTIIPRQLDNILSNVTVGEQLMDTALQYCESILGIRVTYDRLKKYLSIIKDLDKNGFKISNLTDMIQKIFSVAYYLGVDIYDINISNTNIYSVCIFFEADVIVKKDYSEEEEVCIFLNYHDGEIQFTKAYTTLCLYKIDKFDKLMDVINEWK